MAKNVDWVLGLKDFTDMDLFRSLMAPRAVSLVAVRAAGLLGGNP